MDILARVPKMKYFIIEITLLIDNSHGERATSCKRKRSKKGHTIFAVTRLKYILAITRLPATVDYNTFFQSGSGIR